MWKISPGHCVPLTPTPQFRHLSGGISASRISSFLLTVFLKITFRICGLAFSHLDHISCIGFLTIFVCHCLHCTYPPAARWSVSGYFQTGSVVKLKQSSLRFQMIAKTCSNKNQQIWSFFPGLLIKDAEKIWAPWAQNPPDLVIIIVAAAAATILVAAAKPRLLSWPKWHFGHHPSHHKHYHFFHFNWSPQSWRGETFIKLWKMAKNCNFIEELCSIITNHRHHRLLKYQSHDLSYSILQFENIKNFDLWFILT